MEKKEDIWVYWHLINQLAVPGVKCLEDFVLSVLSGFSSWSAGLFLSPPWQKLCHCHCLCWGKSAVPHTAQKGICSQSRSGPASLLHSSISFSHASMHSRKWKFPCSGSDLTQKNETDQFATYFMPLKTKEKTQSNQTNSFSVSNTESELWHSCFR